MKPIRFFILTLLIIVIGCTRKTVQIPVLNVSGIQDTIYDNSQIWIFLEVKDNDTLATLNRKNSIATTNWIYNIDKNLPMRLVVPHLQKLIEKREKPAMHPKDEDDYNYFSFVDSESNLLSMVQFDVIYFTDKPYDKEQFVNDSLKKHLFIDYTKKGISVNDSIIPIDKFGIYLNKLPNKVELKLHLSIDKYLTYQEYLYIKAILQNVEDNTIEIDNEEFIVD